MIGWRFSSKDDDQKDQIMANAPLAPSSIWFKPSPSLAPVSPKRDAGLLTSGLTVLGLNFVVFVVLIVLYNRGYRCKYMRNIALNLINKKLDEHDMFSGTTKNKLTEAKWASIAQEIEVKIDTLMQLPPHMRAMSETGVLFGTPLVASMMYTHSASMGHSRSGTHR